VGEAKAVAERDGSPLLGNRGSGGVPLFVMSMGWKGQPCAQLARVVAPPSHPCERGGGTRRLAFVVHRHLRWSKPTSRLMVVKWDDGGCWRLVELRRALICSDGGSVDPSVWSRQAMVVICWDGTSLRVVAPPSHPYEKAGGRWWVVFVVRERPR